MFTNGAELNWRILSPGLYMYFSFAIVSRDVSLHANNANRTITDPVTYNLATNQIRIPTANLTITSAA